MDTDIIMEEDLISIIADLDEFWRDLEEDYRVSLKMIKYE
jgi:hypothetical protein